MKEGYLNLFRKQNGRQGFCLNGNTSQTKTSEQINKKIMNVTSSLQNVQVLGISTYLETVELTL